MSPRAYLVGGRDDYHDRGVREFTCDAADGAARNYLQAYVEDWRGDSFPKRSKLSMRVWRPDQIECDAAAFTGRISAKHDQHGELVFQYDVEEVPDAQNR